MTTTTVNVTDMHCAACTSKIRAALQGLTGVQTLQFNPVKRQVFITHDDRLAHAQILNEIEQVGFAPQLVADSRIEQQHDKAMLKRLGVAGIAMMQVMMVQFSLYAGMFQGIDEPIRRLLEFTALLFCIPVVAYSAVPFFSNALGSIKRGLNMDAPIALAITVAFCASLYSTLTGQGEVYYDSVVMFTFLMLGARFWESRIRHRLSIEDSLQAALPRFATRTIGDQRIETVLEDLQPGDQVWVAEGGQVPADGLLLSDSARLEEAWLTGESDWQARSAGDLVWAGTMNRGAGFLLQVRATTDQSRIAQIDQLANTAMDSKHKLARLADQVARVFIPTILTIAGLTYVGWSYLDPQQALSAALAVLVVSCPCALSLATPAALTAALTRLRQAGVLVKNSGALEVAAQVSDVYFDKTGTLTDPQSRITDSTMLGSADAADAWQVACALQAHSSHPLARAFSSDHTTPAHNVTLVPAQGVEGDVNGIRARIGSAQFCDIPDALRVEDDTGKTVYLAMHGQPVARYTVASDIRRDAPQTVAMLRQAGYGLHMISGDNDSNCARVADTLQIGYVAAVSPEAKPDAFARAQGRNLYVGDGVNDLPALTQADISAATVETNDLVKSKADVLLLRKGLSGLIDFLAVGQRSRRIMSENLAWAVAYNVIAIPLAALGYVPPWGAALGMSASSLLVMLNSTRLLRVPLSERV